MTTSLGDGWVVVDRTSDLSEVLTKHPATFWGGWSKEQVYSTKPTTLEEHDGGIREVMSSIPQEFLVKSVDAISIRL